MAAQIKPCDRRGGVEGTADQTKSLELTPTDGKYFTPLKNENYQSASVLSCCVSYSDLDRQHRPRVTFVAALIMFTIDVLSAALRGKTRSPAVQVGLWRNIKCHDETKHVKYRRDAAGLLCVGSRKVIGCRFLRGASTDVTACSVLGVRVPPVMELVRHR